MARKLQQLVLFVACSVNYDLPVSLFYFDSRHAYLGRD
jgi:hypothetical protein